MKIKEVYIDKFKLFNKFKIKFNDGLNVIVGENGTGKTTLLEIINNVFLNNLNYFKEDKNFTYVEIKCEIKSNIYDIKVLKEEKDIKIYVNGKNSTKMLQTIKNQKMVYINKSQEDMLKANEIKAKYIKELKVLYNKFFKTKEFVGVDKKTNELQFLIKNTGERLSIKQLNSFERQMLYRIYSLLENRLKEGVVVIDTPEEDMTPKLQQMILKFYRAIDETSQYIVVTNSVHIISYCKENQLQILKDLEGNITVEEVAESMYNKTNNEILENILGVKGFKNLELEEKKARYKSLYRNKKLISGKEQEEMQLLEKELKQYVSVNDDDIEKYDFKREEKMLKGIVSKMKGK